MLSYYSYILENNRIDSIKNKYVDKLGLDPNLFDYFAKHKEILEVALKLYFKTPKERIKDIEKYGTNFHELLINMLKKFVNNKDSINKSINELKDIDELIYELDKLNGYDRIKFDENEIWVLDNSIEYFIFKPYSFNASEYYGYRKIRGTNWCTTYDEEKFKEHFGHFGGLLYVINKYNPDKDWAIEFNINNIIAWDSKNSKEYIGNNIQDIINNIWEPYEKPYVVLMKNLDKLKNDTPLSIDINDAKKMLKEKIKKMDVSEIIKKWGSNYVDIDDNKFFNNLRKIFFDSYKESGGWKYENDLLEKFINFLDYNKLNNAEKQELLDYFITEMKDKNKQLGYNFYNEYIDDIKLFIEDNYNDQKIVKVIDKLLLKDKFIYFLIDDELYGYRNAIDYLEHKYGYIENMRPGYIDYYLSDCVNLDSTAEYIVDSLNKEEIIKYL